MDKSILTIAAVGIGAFALMSFNKKPKTTTSTPTPTPLIADPYVAPTPVIADPYVAPTPVIADPYVAPTPVIIPVLPPNVIVPQQYIPVIPNTTVVAPVQYVAPYERLDMVVIKKHSNIFIAGKTNIIVDILFTNNTNRTVSIGEIQKILIAKSDGSKTLGTPIVSFNDIKLNPLQTVILEKVPLNGLENDVFTYSSVNFNSIVTLTPLYNVVNQNIVIESSDVMVTQQYLVKDANILVYPIKKNTSVFSASSPAQNLYTPTANGNLAYDLNIVIENNTNEDLYLNTIKALKFSVLVGYNFKPLTINQMNFANIVLKANEQLTLNNVIIYVPYDFYGKLIQLTYAPADLKAKTKIDLLF